MKFGKTQFNLIFYCCFTGKERADEKLIKIAKKKEKN